MSKTATTASLDKTKLARAAAMLRTLGLFDERAAFLMVNYGCAGLREMTVGQLDDLLRRLTADVAQRLDAKTNVSKKTLRLRSNVLVILTSLGRGPEKGWAAVNEFLKQPRIAGKLLYDCSDDELVALAKRLRAFGQKEVEKKAAIDFQSKWN